MVIYSKNSIAVGSKDMSVKSSEFTFPSCETMNKSFIYYYLLLITIPSHIEILVLALLPSKSSFPSPSSKLNISKSLIKISI